MTVCRSCCPGSLTVLRMWNAYYRQRFHLSAVIKFNSNDDRQLSLSLSAPLMLVDALNTADSIPTTRPRPTALCIVSQQQQQSPHNSQQTTIHCSNPTSTNIPATAMAASSTINLHELEQELARTKSMFEQWSAATLARAQSCKAAHLSKLMASKGLCVCAIPRHCCGLL